MSPTLSPLQQVVYPYVCRGYTSAEIAEELGSPWTKKSVADTTDDLLVNLGLRRMELIIVYNEANCPSTELPLEAYRQAAEAIEELTPTQMIILAAYHEQWESYCHRQSSEQRKPPSRDSVAIALAMNRCSLGNALTRAYRRLFGKQRTFTWKLVRLYDMALRYRQITYTDSAPEGLGRREKIAYADLCQAADPSTTAAKVGCSLDAARHLATAAMAKVQQGRVEIALRFLDRQGIGSAIPIGEYRAASVKIAALTPKQQDILAEYLMQWRKYMSAETRPAAYPDRASVGEVLVLSHKTVQEHLQAIHCALSLTCTKEVRDCAALRLYEMSRIYADFVTDYGDAT